MDATNTFSLREKYRFFNKKFFNNELLEPNRFYWRVIDEETGGLTRLSITRNIKNILKDYYPLAISIDSIYKKDIETIESILLHEMVHVEVAKIQKESMEELQTFLIKEIRAMDEIERTSTMISLK